MRHELEAITDRLEAAVRSAEMGGSVDAPLSIEQMEQLERLYIELYDMRYTLTPEQERDASLRFPLVQARLAGMRRDEIRKMLETAQEAADVVTLSIIAACVKDAELKVRASHLDNEQTRTARDTLLDKIVRSRRAHFRLAQLGKMNAYQRAELARSRGGTVTAEQMAARMGDTPEASPDDRARIRHMFGNPL